MYLHLLVKLLSYIRSFINLQTIQDLTVFQFYKAVIRGFLVILHDFPDFLVKYSIQLVDELPFQLI